MTNHRDGSDLDAYLDGLMDDADRLRFERRLLADDALRQELATARSIENSLRRTMQPTALAPGDLADVIDGPVTPQRPEIFGRWRLVSAAAAMLLVLVAWWSPWRPGVDPAAVAVGASWAELYQNAADRDFNVGSDLCNTPAQLTGLLGIDLGRNIDVRRDTDVVLRGVCSSPDYEELRAMVVQAAPDLHVLVFVAALVDDPRPQLPERSSLHLHRHALEPFVIYELSPSPTACTSGCYRLGR
ncbi:MAG: hypothetical protein AAF628_22885 [Planctomycetota bacterium]